MIKLLPQPGSEHEFEGLISWILVRTVIECHFDKEFCPPSFHRSSRKASGGQSANYQATFVASLTVTQKM